jgi:predicted PurR-regulated permease PerM
MDDATAPADDPAALPAADEPAPTPLAPAAVGVAILAVIAVVAALYLARAFFVPLLIGIIASYSLSPMVEWLAARRIPRAVGAALALVAVVAGTTWAVSSLGEDAASVIETLPGAARKMREQVSVARAGGPSALNKIQEAASELQGAAADATGDGKSAKPKRPAVASRDAEPSVWLRDYMLAQSALLFTVVAQAPIVVLLTYFLLASGAHFRRKLVQLVGPSLSHKKDAVRILDEIDTQIHRYLLATLGANVLVAVLTGLAFAALGMQHAVVWGMAAGILHFIPYLGPVLFAIASGVAGFTQFGTALGALTVAGVSLLVAAAVGQLIMTWMQSRLSRVNAAVLFIALLFFGWLWGIWGLLLGAPLLAIAKVICDRIDSLKPVGALLGR